MLTAEEKIEMDASIMDGKTMNCGAVVGVSTVRNPVSLARMVMESTDHVMICGEGTTKFAQKMNVPLISYKELITKEARAELETFKKYRNTVSSLFRCSDRKGMGHDTVECVAIDLHGNLAAATSTGGITCKLPGRVGGKLDIPTSVLLFFLASFPG